MKIIVYNYKYYFERKFVYMKKFRKFMVGTFWFASIAAGAYYVYKNYIKKDTTDDFDDFEDDFEDFDTDDDEVETTVEREYVSINLNPQEELISEEDFEEDEETSTDTDHAEFSDETEDSSNSPEAELE